MFTQLGFKEGAVPSEMVNEATRREWRELGFFYERDDARSTWLILGSRSGLLTFARILLEYSNNPQRRQLSEHDHFGPYAYLEIGTWRTAEITDHWIAGTLADLNRLSGLVEKQVLNARTGDRLPLREAYAPNASYELVLELCDDDFDPAAADAACW